MTSPTSLCEAWTESNVLQSLGSLSLFSQETCPSVKCVSVPASVCCTCSRAGARSRKAKQNYLKRALCKVYGTNNSTERSRCMEGPKLRERRCVVGLKPSANIWRVLAKDTSLKMFSLSPLLAPMDTK